MRFDWADYLKLARDLEEGGRIGSWGEAAPRSAISRAYYAAFCSARNFLRDKGVKVPKTGKAHTVVPDKFIRSREIGRRKLGVELGRLRDDRRRADYEDEIKNPVMIAEKAIKNSERILNWLAKEKDDR